MSRQSRATLVGSFLAEEIIDLYFGSDSTEARESLLDRFRIEAGREISSSGDESVMFEFEFAPKFSLQAERDAYNDYNMGVVYRIRF